MNKCVYVHKLLSDEIIAEKFRSTGDIVYVGSGTLYRSKEKASRSIEHTKIWDKLTVEIVAENLTEDQARELEQSVLLENFDLGLLNRTKTVPPRYKYYFEELSKYFYLDESFVLRWKVDRYSGRGFTKLSAKAGDAAGSYHKTKGYLSVSLNSVLLQGHRIIYCLFNKVNIPSNQVIDHLDNNPRNNHPSNLELKTYSQNNLNRGSMKLSKTGHRGILRDKNKITVQWYENGKRFSRGFPIRPYLKVGLTTEEAVEATLREAVAFNKEIRSKVYGEFDLNKS